MVVLIINCHDKQVEYFFFFSLQIKGEKNPQGKRDMGNENMKTGILLILIFHHALTQQSLMPFNYLTRLNCKWTRLSVKDYFFHTLRFRICLFVFVKRLD